MKVHGLSTTTQATPHPTLTGKSLITDPKGLSIHYIQNNDYDDDGYYGYYYRPRNPFRKVKIFTSKTTVTMP